MDADGRLGIEAGAPRPDRDRRAMKAWRLTPATGSLELTEVPSPDAREGAVVVGVDAAPVVSYLRDYVAGTLTGYRPPPGTFTPGTSAIGTVASVGPGVYALRRGQRVLLTGHYRAPENVPDAAQALLGLTAPPGSDAVLETWRDGTFAEQVVVPASTVTPVPPGLDHVGSALLAAAIRCLVPYGGWVRGRLAPGETVVVNGATGAFGSAAVHVALALGAARVVAAGRNPHALASMAALERVATVALSGDVAADGEALRRAADAPVTVALDLVGNAAGHESTRAALDALGRGGRLVLMGSMAVPLPVDYTALMVSDREILGAFMYPPSAPTALLSLVASGLLDLTAIPVERFPLPALPAAMERAATARTSLVVVGE